MSRRARRVLMVAGVVASVAVVGQALVPGRRSSGAAGTTELSASPPVGVAARTPAAPAVPTAAAGAGLGTTLVAGAPMGYSHDRAGAKAAALAFARSYSTLVALDDAGAEAAKRAMASSASADGLVAAMRARLAAVRRVWPVGTLSYRVAPLAVRVAMNGPDAADADVWYVGVVTARSIPTYEEWVTETYRLVWERDDWRIATESDSPGPRPDPGRQSPAPAGELDARLAGFEAP